MDMKRTMKMIALLALFGFLLMPVVSMAAELEVQTVAAQSNAFPGGSGAGIGSSALITVVVTSNGVPQKRLGNSVGDGSAEIALPSGWKLLSHIAPPGGCSLTPTEFYNWGDGSYSIRVVPFVRTAGCAWLAGDYHYVVQLSKGARAGTFTGSGLGVLTIK
jgi:hypothetical protein